MAPGKDAVEFNKIIQADRDKKKKQDLADRIFGRRSSAPAAGAPASRKPTAGPSSLSGRGGIAKASKPARSTRSANPLFQALNHQNATLHRSTSSPQLNKSRNGALDAAINGRSAPQSFRDQANIRGGISGRGSGISVKGSASQPQTFSIVAQNFAPGTTADDIESVFAPNPDAVGLLSCKLLLSSPTVIAELVFDNLESAEDLVATFNNKKADNRLLHVYVSKGSPQQPIAMRGTRQNNTQPAAIPIIDDDTSMMDVEEARPRSQAPPRGPRAQPQVQDGRFGFRESAAYPQNEYRGGQGGGRLVSDGMIGRQSSRGPGRNDRYPR